MDKIDLVSSAQALPPVSAAAADEYSRKAEVLANAVSAVLLQRADIEALVGKNNLDMMKDNHANHARFIASILQRPNAEVLVESVLWVFRAYRSHGFATNYWAAQLNTWFQVLPQQLSAASWAEIRPWYEWLQVNIPIFVLLTDKSKGGQ
ncbi:hypothetical protein [Oligosphaera ethanolica]|uniref:Uncharacterized protein n=1 Tax=Oligosphaera ethanolica TaxID=760260 RepID=A0AAE3VEB2_9BACT|nr:hypothetical protein [Oligosphaera ethanolica]MDQ0288728.1 hypothetical protein [Oligosphaera ethanolica]